MDFVSDWAGDVGAYAFQAWAGLNEAMPFATLIPIGIGLMFAPRIALRIYRMFGGQ